MASIAGVPKAPAPAPGKGPKVAPNAATNPKAPGTIQGGSTGGKSTAPHPVSGTQPAAKQQHPASQGPSIAKVIQSQIMSPKAMQQQASQQVKAIYNPILQSINQQQATANGLAQKRTADLQAYNTWLGNQTSALSAQATQRDQALGGLLSGAQSNLGSTVGTGTNVQNGLASLGVGNVSGSTGALMANANAQNQMQNQQAGITGAAAAQQNSDAQMNVWNTQNAGLYTTALAGVDSALQTTTNTLDTQRLTNQSNAASATQKYLSSLQTANIDNTKNLTSLAETNSKNQNALQREQMVTNEGLQKQQISSNAALQKDQADNAVKQMYYSGELNAKQYANITTRMKNAGTHTYQMQENAIKQAYESGVLTSDQYKNLTQRMHYTAADQTAAQAANTKQYVAQTDRNYDINKNITAKYVAQTGRLHYTSEDQAAAAKTIQQGKYIQSEITKNVAEAQKYASAAKGSYSASNAEVNSQAKTMQATAGLVQQLLAAGAPPQDIRKAMLQGNGLNINGTKVSFVPAGSKPPTSGKSFLTGVTSTGKPTSAATAVSNGIGWAGFDMAVYGHITANTESMLQKAGWTQGQINGIFTSQRATLGKGYTSAAQLALGRNPNRTPAASPSAVNPYLNGPYSSPFAPLPNG